MSFGVQRKNSGVFAAVKAAASKVEVKIGFVVLAVVVALGIAAFFLLADQRRSSLARATTDSLRLARIVVEGERRFIAAGTEATNVFASSPATLNDFACDDFAAEFLAENSGYTNFGAAHLNGDVYCSADPAFVGSNIGQTAFFKDAIESDGAITGFPRVSKVTKAASFIIAKPLYDKNFAVAGVAFAAQKFDWLERTLVASALPADAAIGFVDGEGESIVRVTNERVRASRDLSQLFTSKTVFTQGEGIAEDIRDGVGRFIAFKALTDRTKMPLAYAYVDLPTASLDGLGRSAALRMLVLLIIAALAAFAGGTALARYLVLSKLQRVIRAAYKVADGDFGARVGPIANSEIGKLGEAFDGMAEKLARFYDDLEGKLAKQNADLTAVIERGRLKNRDFDEARQAMMNMLDDLELDQGQISKEKARAEALLAGIGDAVIAADTRGVIVYANGHCADLLGVPRERLIGKIYLEEVKMVDIRGKNLPRQNRAYARVLETGAQFEYNSSKGISVVRTDGSLLPIAVVASPIFESGAISGIVVLMRDVSVEREIDRAKTDFVSVASHQLRTPPTAVRWYSEMLLSGDAGKMSVAQRKAVEEIHDSTMRMIELISSLLSVSRIEMGMYAVQPQLMAVPPLVAELVEEANDEISQKRLTVQTVVAKGFPELFVDPQILRIIVQNLLSNAVKYTPEDGTIRITMTVEGEMARFDIADSGYGIPLEQQYLVFSKFFRASNVNTLSVQGSGLGLYIVRTMCKYAGCKLWFKSEPGKGTTFSFSIPKSGMVPKEGDHTVFVGVAAAPPAKKMATSGVKKD